MGTIIGAVAGLVLFSIFGLLPAYRFGSFLALHMLYKVTGRSVESIPVARAFIIAGALLSILCGAAISLFGGALLGSIFLLQFPLHDLSVFFCDAPLIQTADIGWPHVFPEFLQCARSNQDMNHWSCRRYHRRSVEHGAYEPSDEMGSLNHCVGGGTAALFHGASTLLRGTSTAVTGGLGNHAVATAELGIASGLSILSIALPLVSSVVVLMLLLFVVRKGLQRLFKQRRAEAAS